MKYLVVLCLSFLVCIPTSSQAGLIVRFIFDGVGEAATVNNTDPFTTFPNIPDRPTRKEVTVGGLQVVGLPTAVTSGESFVSLVRGYITPPETGDYIFYVRSDDGCKFFLSPNATPANKTLVCREPGANTPWVEDGIHNSAPIPLVAGSHYYFEVQHVELTGGDQFTIAWRKPNGSFEAPIPPGGFIALPLDEVTHGPKTTAPIIPEGIFHQFPVSGHPADVEIPVGGSAQFHVGVEATPPVAFQWRRNGVIVPGATNGHFSLPFVSGLDYGTRYDAVIQNAQGSVTSRWATVALPFESPTNSTVQGQTVGQQGAANFIRPALPLGLVAALTRGNPNGVDLIFTTAVDEALATTLANYAVTPGVTVQSARLINNRTVRLTTSKIDLGQAYTVTVNGLQSRGPIPQPLAPNTSAPFVQAQNAIQALYFNNIGGNPTSALLDSNRYPGDPDFVEFNSSVESWPNRGDAFGIGYFGYFVPTVTGNHIFYLSGDDTSDLFLNTAGEQAPGTLVASMRANSGFREYLAGTDEANRVDANSGTANPRTQSAPLMLVAGVRYYMEARMKEGGGGDHFALGVTRVGDVPIVNGDAPVGPANLDLLSPGGPITLVGSPTVVTTGETPTRIEVRASGARPHFYQWMRNGERLSRQVGESLVLGELSPEESDGDFTVVVGNHFSSVTSQVARVTGPASGSISLLTAQGSSPSTVVLRFSQPLSAEAALDPTNYTITTPDGLSSLPISLAELSADQQTVTLFTAPQTGFALYVVTVSNLANESGQPLVLPAQALFRAWDFKPGTLLQENYHGIPYIYLHFLERSPRFPLQPDTVSEINSFMIPANVADDYGVRITGWITPPSTDVYKFLSTQDDASKLFISTDANPDNKVLIIHAQQVIGAFADNGASSSGPILLEAGKYYYIEGWMKEAGGGDHFTVGMRQVQDTAAPTPLAGPTIAYFKPSTTEGVAIIRQPMNVTTPLGTVATFKVAALTTQGEPTYQWFRNLELIPEATAASYTTPSLTPADDGSSYTCIVTLGEQSATSAEARITIGASATPVTLTITRSGNEVTVSWPAEVLGAILQSTSSLNPPIDWVDEPSSAGNQTFTTPATANQRFYRLKQ